MQLRKMAFVAVLSTMGFMMAGCPEDTATSTSCSTTSDCVAESEICHPTAKVCVQTCTESSDCPDSSPTCAAVSASDPTRVCQCTTDSGCNTDREVADLVCDPESAVCVQRCTSDASCNAGDTCNLTTGVCEAGGDTGDTCSGTAQSTCSYGNFCSAGTCAAVPAPTCDNFNPAQGGKTPVWTATGSTGPIIYEITQVSYANDSFCAGAGDVTAKARVRAYQPAAGTATFPADKANLPGLFYVRVNGSQVDGSSLIRPSEYTTSNGGKNAEFTMNFCPGATSTTLSIGLYFTGGNEICAQLNK